MGYAGGIEKKVELLKLEKVDMKEIYIPKKGTALKIFRRHLENRHRALMQTIIICPKQNIRNI